ncbi:MAG: CPBP family glutamic-type intramembrane protease [Enhygromyxa sp.]
MGYRGALSFCRECGAPWTEGASACTRCGTERTQPAAPSEGMSSSRGLASAAMLYGMLLVTVLVPYLVLEGDVIDTLDTILILDTLVVAIWAIVHRHDVLGPLRRLGELRYWAITLAAVPLTVAIAYANSWLAIDVLGAADADLIAWYLAAGRSLPVVLLLAALQPAVVEELAFRGVIFERLSPVVEPKTAVLVSAAAFTILHLSLLSVVFLMTLGLLAGWLRWRSGSLYPAIALHLLHNATVALLVHAGIW